MRSRLTSPSLSATASKNDAGTRLVEIVRTFDAPRELVFRMWTQPELLERWYAPRRCRLEVLRFDFRRGGDFRYRIVGPDGSGCLCSGAFTDIVAPERIVYRLFFSDAQGGFVSAKSAGADPHWPDRDDGYGDLRREGAAHDDDLAPDGV